MKKLLITLLVTFHFAVGSAQQVFSLDDDQTSIDSLKTLIKSSLSDSTKSALNLKLSNIYRRNKQLDLSNKYINEAKKHIKNNPFLKDYILYYDAIQLLNKGDYQGFDNALVRINKRLEKYKIKEAYRLRATILSNHAVMQQLFNDEQKAVEIIINEAIPVAVKSGDNELVGYLYKSVGIIFMNYPDRKKANEYLSEAMIYFNSADKASPTFKENKVETLIVHAENLIELQNYKAANTYLDEAYTILKKHPKSNLNSIYYFSKGLYLHKNKYYDKAILSFKKGIENADLHNGIFTKFRLQFAMHQSYMALKEFTKSRDILVELLAKNTFLKVDQKAYMKDLASVYEKLGDNNKATQYYKSYIELNDSLNNATHTKDIIELEAKFNRTQNKNKIRQLESQKTEADLLAKNNRLQYVVMALIAGVLLVILILILVYLRSKNRLEIERNLKNKEKYTLLKNQKEVEVMQAMINGEELERKRIARELHDGIGSKLSALKIMLNRLEIENKDQKEVEHINKLLSSSINELRQVSYNLVPESLLKLGLENALSDLCHLLHSDKVKIEFHPCGIHPEIPISIQINIYRIVQELVNNALKHSECNQILISCSQNEDTILIAVEDNGKGFDYKGSNSKSGHGLKNLKSRVAMLNGILNVESGATGTYYNIELNIGI